MHLSKSSFKTARDCPAKLYYSKMNYPSTMRENPFLAYLAEGGFMVEKMAQLLFPEGQETNFELRETEKAAAYTRDWMASTSSGVLFEAVIAHDGYMARVDILEKEGNVLKLHEVKSISANREDGESPFRGKRGNIDARRRDYVEDICFQALVAEKAFPDYRIEPDLCILDKSKAVGPDATLESFHLTMKKEGAYSRPEVSYDGDPVALRSNHPLWFVDVSTELKELREELAPEMKRFAKSLRGKEPTFLPGELGPHCKGCEYRYHAPAELIADPDLKDGFRHCWRKRALADPHVLDLYHCGGFAGGKSRRMKQICQTGSESLCDLNPEECTGKRGERQKIQIQHTQRGEEYLNPMLPKLLEQHPYPLHFIDFETTRTALPYHEGMHPYELITFQWSCHTLREPGGRLEHTEGINSEHRFPNFDFARSLRDQIGDDGTVYIWSHHENSCMAAIAKQLETAEEKDPELLKWLHRFEQQKDIRIIDLCKMTREYYFHPQMKGSSSIKAVLPAIWQNTPELWKDPDFQDYVDPSSDQQADPYKQLPDLPLDGGLSLDAIREGTGAIRAYEDIIFGRGATDKDYRGQVVEALLQYCKLDTLAMVMIWKRWTT